MAGSTAGRDSLGQHSMLRSVSLADQDGSGIPRLLWAGTLVWFILAALWVTWTPIQLSEDPNRPQLFPGSSPLELLSNFLLLAPLGYVLALGPARRRVVAGAVGGACLSLMIELGQIFLLGRIVSLMDLLLNTLGAAAGAAGAIWLGRRIGAARALGGGGALMFIGLLGFALQGARVFDSSVRIADWNPTYLISVGDEIGGGKEYRGSIAEARICSVESGRSVCAAAGAGAALRQRLVSAAEQSQQLDVYAHVVPETTQQWGPTRIITFSSGWYARNVTLGQEGSALVLRLRTPLMGSNGRAFEIWVPRAFSAGVALDIHSRFRNNIVSTELTSAGGTRVLHHTFDVFSSGLLLRGDGEVTPLQMRATRTLGAIILFMPLILAGLAGVLGLKGRNHGRQHSA
jgi:VanZ family protein